MNSIKLAVLSVAALLPVATAFAAAAAPQNLVSNGDFSNGVANWKDFSGNPTPFFGGMALSNDYAGGGNSYYSAVQCIKDIAPGGSYLLTGQAVVAKPAPEFGSASLTLHFFATEDCSGPVVGGGSDRDGLNPDRQGIKLDLSVSTTAPKEAKSAWVRLTAMKEPKAPANSAPGELVVAWDNISLVRQYVLVPRPPAPEVDEPPPAEEPEPEPQAEPEPQPEPAQPDGEPAAPADAPAQTQDNPPPAAEPGSEAQAGVEGEPAADEEAREETPDVSGLTAEPGTLPSEPLPPATGEGEEVENIGWMVIAGCLAAIAAGGMMVLFGARRRGGE